MVKWLNNLGLLSVLSVVMLLAACGDATSTPAPATAAVPAPAGGIPPASGSPVKTASGLQYIDLKAGQGAEAVRGRTASVHYTGWLANGTKFDSSLDRGQPFPFPVGGGRVIRGWDEGVAGMKVGGKRRLLIPPALGYGPQGFPPVIPPNADLVFDVELLEVK